MLPLLLFSSARAGVAFTPLNYRLSADGLRELIDRLPQPLVIADAEYRDIVVGAGKQVIDSDEFVAQARTAEPGAEFPDPDDVGVVLFTSGTTSRPKAVELTHNNLTSYITGTVEFDSADPDDAALICVPPYHVAGVGAALSNLYAGRKMVYLRQFDANEWVRLVARRERHDGYRGADDAGPGGCGARKRAGRAAHVAEPGLWRFQGGTSVGTQGSWAPTGCRLRQCIRPHRNELHDRGPVPRRPPGRPRLPDETVARRLGSVGQPVPGIEVQIRGDNGEVLQPGETGELFVRGDQVSGRYAEIGSVLDAEGWFPTKDIAMLDGDGYLFIGGRSDDTIIRGGENIAPAEIEDVLVEHPSVRDCVVVGPEDPQWGQIIVAVVVPADTPDGPATPDPDELREYVRTHLRGSRTPDRVVFRDELPTNATGKVLRRELIDELTRSRT